MCASIRCLLIAIYGFCHCHWGRGWNSAEWRFAVIGQKQFVGQLLHWPAHQKLRDVETDPIYLDAWNSTIGRSDGKFVVPLKLFPRVVCCVTSYVCQQRYAWCPNNEYGYTESRTLSFCNAHQISRYLLW